MSVNLLIEIVPGDGDKMVEYTEKAGLLVGKHGGKLLQRYAVTNSYGR